MIEIVVLVWKNSSSQISFWFQTRSEEDLRAVFSDSDFLALTCENHHSYHSLSVWLCHLVTSWTAYWIFQAHVIVRLNWNSLFLLFIHNFAWWSDRHKCWESAVIVLDLLQLLLLIKSQLYFKHSIKQIQFKSKNMKCEYNKSFSNLSINHLRLCNVKRDKKFKKWLIHMMTLDSCFDMMLSMFHDLLTAIQHKINSKSKMCYVFLILCDAEEIVIFIWI